MTQSRKRASRRDFDPTNPRSTRPVRVVEAYQNAVLRAVLQAVGLLQALDSRGVKRRDLVNYLRGSSPPPPGRESENGGRQGHVCFALLDAYPARRLEEIVDSLADEGYLEYTLGPGTRVAMSRGGATAKARQKFPPTIFPRPARLGENERLERRLRALRQALAKRSRCAPYAVFPNATLAALAAKRPRTLAELAEVGGMGAVRVRRYGKKILTALSKSGKP